MTPDGRVEPSMVSPVTELSLEYLDVGRRFTSGERVVDQEEMTAFAAAWSAHYDRRSASTYSLVDRTHVVLGQRAVVVENMNPRSRHARRAAIVLLVFGLAGFVRAQSSAFANFRDGDEL